ncbi:hypothetical protein HEP_00062600 [Hepatocystis sp. ex Piliocolobus tephrosceles]|nr:hypothetical protein HEP_00062600 [Hepatocystis sp. ex Piliocolobus tephrosceles]
MDNAKAIKSHSVKSSTASEGDNNHTLLEKPLNDLLVNCNNNCEDVIKQIKDSILKYSNTNGSVYDIHKFFDGVLDANNSQTIVTENIESGIVKTMFTNHE